VEVNLGEEGEKAWKTKQKTAPSWEGDNGWGYARLKLNDSDTWTVTVRDTVSSPEVELEVTETESTLKLDLPDEQFIDSLNAQVAHIMMGLVDKETRPGEPTNYPSSWQRDGAYQIVALTRAGQLEVAKELSTYFAENDFFGGFGPEADAPGLSIWALKQVAEQLNDPEYNQWLWPHVRRKAEFILEMLATEQPIHQPVSTSIVPQMMDKKYSEVTLVADPAQNGLAIGRMDNQRPLLFVNAVSYRGLLDAASLAERVNRPTDARRWRTKATELQQAWEMAFKAPELDNPRTYISGLWPTWVAASHEDFQENLHERWTELRNIQGEFHKTPLQTYFDIAEAHQWLFLEKPERVWATLRWFWNHQASPGLYTWWEGNGEQNTSGRWEQVRGWIDPPHVTPHYWTAAEMLLLQLDMLVYLEQDTYKPAFVVGAGVPEEWLNQPMSVKEIPVQGSRVSWEWDGQEMHVQVQGQQNDVKLGSAFPANTPLSVEYIDFN
jgi:hypothetical protein